MPLELRTGFEFFFSLTEIIDIYHRVSLRCTVLWFYVWIYCKVITAVRLGNVQFLHFWMFKNIKWKILFFDIWKWHEIQVSLSVRALLEHSHNHCFCTDYGHFHAVVAEWSHCDKDHIVSRVWNIYFLALDQQRWYSQWLMMFLRDLLKVPESEVDAVLLRHTFPRCWGREKVPNERQREDWPGFPHNVKENILSTCEEYIIS